MTVHDDFEQILGWCEVARDSFKRAGDGPSTTTIATEITTIGDAVKLVRLLNEAVITASRLRFEADQRVIELRAAQLRSERTP